MVSYLGYPLGGDVVEGDGGDDGVAENEDVGLGVGERTQAIVVLLPSRVPEAQVHAHLVHLRLHRVVVEPVQINRYQCYHSAIET